MDNIFGINAIYKDSDKTSYTRTHLIEILNQSLEPDKSSEYEYKKAKKRCAELCPMTFAGKSFPKAPQERFEYLQFLYYIIEKNRRCKEKGYSVFDCISAPSGRYFSLYAEMMGEIQEKVSKAAEFIAIGATSTEFEPAQHGKIGYDDSIHTLQQFSDLIAQTLDSAYNFGRDALNTLKNRETLFYGEINRLKKEYYPKVPLKSWWDELFFRLSYAKCMYWELDLLWAFKQVSQMAPKLLSVGTKYFEPLNERLDLGNDCLLAFDDAQKSIQEIHMTDIMAKYPELDENEALSAYMNSHKETVQEISSYIDSLQKYIKDHVEEITKLVFHVNDASNLLKKRILNRTLKICEYLKMEHQRYGRNCNFTKIKLILVYRAFFSFLPKSDIASTKSGTIKAQTPSGQLREKNTLSSSYSNSNEKDPRFLQLICLWTDFLVLRNKIGACFAKKWVDCNIAILEAILIVNYQSGMTDIQLHAEKILLATMDSLIPDEDGRVQLDYCIKTLSNHGYRFGVCDSSKISLLKFGKFCKLFGFDIIDSLIKKELDIRKRKLLYLIDLKESAVNAFRIHSPILRISYCRANDTYMLHSFFFQNWKPLGL